MSTGSDRRAGERRLAAMLGPAEPELSCEECFERLDAYVEAELAGESADERVQGMRAHLDGCPACAEDFASLHDFVVGRDGPPPDRG